MEQYTRAKKEAIESEPPAENEVRVVRAGKLRHYVSQALALLEEKHLPTIQLTAMGQAINKTVAIAEIIKRRFQAGGLHQLTKLSSVSVTDTWEPKPNATEEGLNTLVVARNMSAITIHLATAATGLDTAHAGYQAPLPADQMVPVTEEDLDDMEAGEALTSAAGGRGGRGRGGGYRSRRGRGGRGRRGGPGGEGGAEGGGHGEGGAPGPSANGGGGGEAHGDGGGQDAGGEGAAPGGGGRGRRNRGRGRGRGRGGRGRGRQDGGAGGEGGGDAAPAGGGDA